MIERHHYFRLAEPYSTREAREETAKRTRETLAALPGVLSLSVGLPADAEAEAAWDLSVTIRFASLDDVARYRADPAHRRFVDEFLAPRIAVKKIWNFVIDG